MKKHNKSKLRLNSETIRTLVPSELPGVAGAQIGPSVSKCYCETDMCPTGFARCAGSTKCSPI